MKNNWRADEMEMAINFKAMRLSWLFVGIALTVWCIVKFARDHDFPTIPFIILMTQNIIFFSAKLWIANRMASVDKVDQNDEK